jgi:hypothetical protein
MGFCVFSNVAVAARAAQAAGLKRVAIVDFDVHHGNGTQAVFENDPTVFFASIHQSPLYPGTGDPSETGWAISPTPLWPRTRPRDLAVAIRRADGQGRRLRARTADRLGRFRRPRPRSRCRRRAWRRTISPGRPGRSSRWPTPAPRAGLCPRSRAVTTSRRWGVPPPRMCALFRRGEGTERLARPTSLQHGRRHHRRPIVAWPRSRDVITLARHGEPALSRKVRLNAPEYGDWWGRYEVGGSRPARPRRPS